MAFAGSASEASDNPFRVNKTIKQHGIKRQGIKKIVR